MRRPPDSRTLADLKAAVGAGGWLAEPAEIEPYLVDWRGLYHGAAPLVLLPRSVEEVSRLLAVCDRDGTGVVAQGGNTSYCGGATPDESGAQVVIALRRMNRLRRMDAADDCMTVECGMTLAAAQAAAREAGRLFPLSLGSEGTAQIGGNLATNAGGTAVLRYGMMRDLVLGLEVVLAGGSVLPGLSSLRKDNTGYDVRSLFIGSEGTLGIITAASLKLFPLPADSATALVGTASPRDSLDLMIQLRAVAGDRLTSFEIMPRRAVELTVRHVDGVANPLDQAAPWFSLVELTSPNPREDLAALLAAELGTALESGRVQGASLASSLAQARAMWRLRESVPAAQTRHGASLKHDVAVPVSALPLLVERGAELVRRLAPEGELIGYGHVGDGNLHFNVSQREGADRAAFLARKSALESAIFDLVASLGGSFSAEHGIGRLKAAELARRADPVEYALMQALKRTLDPNGILNPGKVLE